jgi:myo-inositol-1(or 4)-monophosphatase
MADRAAPRAADLPALLAFAVEVAEAAGPIALRYFRAPLEVQNKRTAGGFDPVTRADREVEAFIRGEIARRFPDHGIIGEEAGSSGGTGALQWIIDPIDGTRAFISGSTAWGTLIGLLQDQRPVAGVVHVPYLGETFYGSADGAWMQRAGESRRLETRPTRDLADAILYCTHPETFTTDADRQAFRRVAGRCRMLRYGGDCYSYCMLALGQVDLIIEGSLQPYDIIPIMPIVAAAGGVISDARGATAQHGGVVVTAANLGLHRQALALMGGN